MAAQLMTPQVGELTQDRDIERQTEAGGHLPFLTSLVVPEGEVYDKNEGANSRWYRWLLEAGVEGNGIKPVPRDLRTDGGTNKLFTVFLTCLLCILPLATGALGTTIFQLGLRDAFLVIVFFSLVTCIPPAFMGIGGYQTGMRQMIQARYSFGLYWVIIPILLNTATVTGFSLVGSIVSGQTIAALDKTGGISVNIGIVITCSVAFVTALFGYKVIHIWQRWQWVPNAIALIIAVGCGGKNLVHQAEVPPPTAKQIISYGSLMAGYFLTFGGTVLKAFAYIFLGLWLPSVLLLTVGAAIGGALPNVPSWQTAYASLGTGGVMAEMLEPAGGFGKFVMVVLALSVVGNMSISIYAVALNLQMLLPIFTKIPRIVFIFVTMAIMIPMAIYAAAEWETSLENFLSIIGYWAGCFDAILIEEMVIFRRMDFSLLPQEAWNARRKLPTGLAAVAAVIISLALVIPGMDAAWYTGPIGEKIGDIGFEAAFIVTAMAYFPARCLEIEWMGSPANAARVAGERRVWPTEEKEAGNSLCQSGRYQCSDQVSVLRHMK